jgi:hypothetical protein
MTCEIFLVYLELSKCGHEEIRKVLRNLKVVQRVPERVSEQQGIK